MINTPFWYKHPNILYEKDSIFEFFPSRRFDLIRKLNAVVRLSIFYTVIMILCTKNINYLLIPLITFGITWFIWNRQKDTHTDTIMDESISNQIDDLVKINNYSDDYVKTLATWRKNFFNAWPATPNCK